MTPEREVEITQAAAIVLGLAAVMDKTALRSDLLTLANAIEEIVTTKSEITIDSVVNDNMDIMDDLIGRNTTICTRIANALNATLFLLMR